MFGVERRAEGDERAHDQHCGQRYVVWLDHSAHRAEGTGVAAWTGTCLARGQIPASMDQHGIHMHVCAVYLPVLTDGAPHSDYLHSCQTLFKP